MEIEGYSAEESCNRNGCTGIILEHSSDGGCSCHVNPPCSYCETSRAYCPECSWDGREEQQQVNVDLIEYNKKNEAGWKAQIEERDKQTDLFYKRYRGEMPVDKYESRHQSHTHFSQIIIGIFPKGTETRQSLYGKVKGTFGGRFSYLGETNFKFIAYTD